MPIDKTEVVLVRSGLVKLSYPVNTHLTLKVMLEGFEQIKKLVDKPTQLMVIGHGIRYADYDALKFTTSREATAILRTQAVVTGTLVEKMLASLYLKTHPTSFPTKVFTDESGALNWLRDMN